MNAKQILIKLQEIKDQLREAEHQLQDLPAETTPERILFNAARQGVQASEAELNSAIFALENIGGLTNSH